MRLITHPHNITGITRASSKKSRYALFLDPDEKGLHFSYSQAKRSGGAQRLAPHSSVQGYTGGEAFVLQGSKRQGVRGGRGEEHTEGP
jgi:hypothetical protein